jgi:hypothetical protein
MTAKYNGEKGELTFGEFVAASYRAWGRLRAKVFVRLAVNNHLVVFHRRGRFVITEERH